MFGGGVGVCCAIAEVLMNSAALAATARPIVTLDTIFPPRMMRLLQADFENASLFSSWWIYRGQMCHHRDL